MTTNHYRRAEELLERAAELESTPKHHVAKTLASMAQAHATLALVKATRQATEQAVVDRLLDVTITHDVRCGRMHKGFDGVWHSCSLPKGHDDAAPEAEPEAAALDQVGDACTCELGQCLVHDGDLLEQVTP